MQPVRWNWLPSLTEWSGGAGESAALRGLGKRVPVRLPAVKVKRTALQAW